MPNYNQAPKIKFNGDKNKDTKGWGKAIRTHELEFEIMNGLGDRDMAALKVMLFLTGNAEGFAVSEATICERCNISEATYKNARTKLKNKGWISHTPGKEIIVNYNNIFKGYSNNTSKGYSDNTPKGYCNNTHNNIRDNINNNIIHDDKFRF